MARKLIMDFEDRLRNHLSGQSEIIEITPEGSDAVVNRHQRRARNRMAATGVAVMLAVVGSFGLWTLADSERTTTTAITAPAQTEAEAPDAGTDAASAADGAASAVDNSGADNSGAVNSAAVNFDGSVEVIVSDGVGAPSYGYNTHSDQGVYYVLSTAPGSVGQTGPVDPASYRQNTIYSFEESAGWSNIEITDRWISDFRPSDGVLYILSTGRTDGSLDPAVGVSTDRGASWDWQQVEALSSVMQTTGDEYPISDTTVRLLPLDGRTYVLAQTLSYPGAFEWEEGLKLAQAAGLDVGHHNVSSIDDDGIAYRVIDQSQPLAPCWEIEDRYYQIRGNAYQQIDYEGFESPIDLDAAVADLIADDVAAAEADLVAAGCTNTIACERIQQAYWSIGNSLYIELESAEEYDEEAWIAVEERVTALRNEQSPAFEAQLVEAGCENTILCDRITQATHQQFNEEHQALSDQWSRYDQLTEQEKEDLHAAEDEIWARTEKAIAAALAETDCSHYSRFEEGEGGDDENYRQDLVVTVSWDELGVSLPSNTDETTSEFFELINGQLEPRPLPINPGEIVVHTDSTDGQLRLTSVTQESYYGEWTPDSRPNGTIFTSSDGESWTRSGTTDSPYGPSNGGPGPVKVGDTALRINYEQMMLESVSVTDGAVPGGVLPPPPVGADGEPAELALAVPVDAPTILPPPMIPPMGPAFERSISGGEWQEITARDLHPDAPEEGMVNELLSTPIGVFAIVNVYEPEAHRSVILHSTDGQSWALHTLPSGGAIPIVADDSVLFVGFGSVNQEGEPTPGGTLLIKATS